MHENAQKSRNRLWSNRLLKQYNEELKHILRSKPELKNTPLVIQLKRELDQQLMKKNFLELPLFDAEIIDIAEDSPTMAQRPQIPVPPPYKETDSWSVWIKNLESYFKLTKWTEESDKKELLLYLIGAERRKRLGDSISPAKPEDEAATFVTLKEKCTKLWGTFDSRTTLAQLFVIEQGAESVDEYAARFKATCTKAELTDERVILNKFVSGLRAKKIQADILIDKTIVKFDSALERAKLLEVVYKNQAVDKIAQFDRQP